MTRKKSKKKNSGLKVAHYCLAFIDLLGQRETFKGQRLLPSIAAENEPKIDKSAIVESIRAIYRLQKDAETMLSGMSRVRSNSPLRKGLTKRQKKMWDEMQRTKVTKQRWSDGITAFVSLGDEEIKCPMNGIYNLLGLCGSLCYLGLATHQPIRGAIDIAWGIELHPGEIYGPVVACAYELESEIAKYPRIVIGQEVVNYLQTHIANTKEDNFSQFNKSLAELCLQMLIADADGFFKIHYLGDAFRKSVTQTQHKAIYGEALEYVVDQLRQHQKNENSKLAFRYTHLLKYFMAHPPT